MTIALALTPYRKVRDHLSITEEEADYLYGTLTDEAHIEHHTPMPMYANVVRCPHPITEEDMPDDADPDDWPADGVHVWGGWDGDILICLDTESDEGCEECESSECGLPERARERAAELWWNVSAERVVLDRHRAEHGRSAFDLACPHCEFEADLNASMRARGF